MKPSIHGIKTREHRVPISATKTNKQTIKHTHTHLINFIFLLQNSHQERAYQWSFEYPHKQSKHKASQMRSCKKKRSIQILLEETGKFNWSEFCLQKKQTSGMNEWMTPWITSGSYLTEDKSTSSTGTITRFFPIVIDQVRVTNYFNSMITKNKKQNEQIRIVAVSDSRGRKCKSENEVGMEMQIAEHKPSNSRGRLWLWLWALLLMLLLWWSEQGAKCWWSCNRFQLLLSAESIDNTVPSRSLTHSHQLGIMIL